MLIKLRCEISRLYARRARLLKELHREVSHTISTMLVRSQSFILCIEDLHISVRGKRGALAKTTLSMPDEPDLVEKACFVSEHNTRRFIKLIPVDPRNTSKEKHIRCSKNLSGTISRTSQSHDYANCSGCDDRLNTHVHAAKVIK
ncbi:MAG: hypothetical protein HeimC3_52750 [Candidatus Heimdallarchaeota archaeon LC_3]|nr:MAG: hypothetical protein HeimC3_52750 [Candidatus Heimdallarchaeota archaeon LC_3]